MGDDSMGLVGSAAQFLHEKKSKVVTQYKFAKFCVFLYARSTTWKELLHDLISSLSCAFSMRTSLPTTHL
jgi:hypothetical protein